MAAISAAILLFGAAALVGAALLKACRRDPWGGWGPALGLSVLMAAASFAVRLPGEGVAAALACAALLVPALAYLGRDLGGLPAPHVVAALALVLVGTLLPFIATGALSLLGASVNNDIASHVGWAEALREAGPGLPLPSGYPLGPHALVAAVAEALGMGTDMAFAGLLMAIPLTAATAALPLLEGVPRPQRAVAAALVALPYLAAAYFSQGAFKETLQGVLLLLFVGVLREVALARRLDGGGAVLFLVVVAGCFSNYSYLGFSWPLAALGVWLVAELLLGGGWLRPLGALRRGLGTLASSRRNLVAATLLALALGVMLAPDVVRALRFYDEVALSPSETGVITTATLGNLVNQLSPFQVLGLWPEEDFRRYFEMPRDAYKAGLCGALALASLLFAMAWWTRRRDFALPSAVVGAGAMYAYLKGGQSPYVTAKALAVPAPIVMALVLGPLLHRDPGPLLSRPARDLLAVGFVAVALLSSFLALRSGSVWPERHRDELATFRPLVAGSEVLYLPVDEFSHWTLRGAYVSEPVRRDQTVLRGMPSFVTATQSDFDSLSAPTLDRFGWAITARTEFQSEPPANFRPAARTDSFVLWRRTGRTPRRRVLAQGPNPGEVLDCRSRRGRRIAALTGWARVRPKPITVSGLPGNSLPQGEFEGVPPGGRTLRQLRLPPGRHALSMAYLAQRAPRVSAPGFAATPPAQLDRPGPRWPLGVVDWKGGRFEALVEVPPMRLRARLQATLIGELAAVPLDVAPRLVPLRRACGEYVDWYTVGPRRPSVPRRPPLQG